MGLAERRGVKEYQEKAFPKVKKEISDAAGFLPDLDVKWDSLMVPEQQNQYAELYQTVFFRPLITAIKAVAVDDMGKQALKTGLKKVVVEGNQASSPSMFAFENGVLELKHDPFCNLQDENDRAKAIQKLFEAKL